MALIEREALRRRFENYRRDCEEAGDTVAAQVFADCIMELEGAPAISAAPVVYGRWIHDVGNLYGCSECMKRETMSPKKLKNYCPSCGALIDGGEEHETD